MRAILISFVTQSVFIAGLFSVVGCGGGGKVPGRPDLAPVSGVVTYKGQAVEGATITFQPQTEKMPAAFGKTDAQGRFQLQTFESNDGAVPGEHGVTVVKVNIITPEGDGDEDEPDTITAPPPERLIPEKYKMTGTSGLTASVSADQPNEFTFDLQD